MQWNNDICIRIFRTSKTIHIILQSNIFNKYLNNCSCFICIHSRKCTEVYINGIQYKIIFLKLIYSQLIFFSKNKIYLKLYIDNYIIILFGKFYAIFSKLIFFEIQIKITYFLLILKHIILIFLGSSINESHDIMILDEIIK